MDCVFLHGLGQTPASWEKTTAAMEGGQALSCPNLADWLAGQEPTYAHLYHMLEAYCARFAEPVALCGLSLGGVLALQYAIEHPGRVRALALIGAQYRMPKGLLRVQDLIFRVMPDCAFQPMGLGKQTVLTLTRSMMDLNVQRGLGRIRCPTLVLCGARDRANRAAARELSTQIPRAELSLIPHAGHEANVDAPDALGARLSAFFQTCVPEVRL